MEHIVTSDLYMRYRDKDGNHHVMHHYVWDSALFVAARHKEARLSGGTAERITLAQYQAEK